MQAFLRIIGLGLVVLFLLLGKVSWAQVPTFEWAKGAVEAVPVAPYTQQAQARGVAADARGNTYVTGIFRGTLTLGSTTLTAINDYDVYVAKLDAAGTCLWAAQAGGNDWDISNAVALDASGNVYVTGYFESTTANFGAVSLPSAGNGASLFVAKLSPTGAWLQATTVTGPETSFLYMVGTALAVDGAGGVYVTGGFNGGPRFGANALACYGAYTAFVAKLSPAGTWEWAVTGGGRAYDFGAGIALDGSGNAYVTGTFEGNTGTFGATTLQRAGVGSDVFVGKLSAAGRWLWATHAGAATSAGGRGIAVDPAGNAYITGFVAGTAARLGGLSLPKADPSPDLLVAKLDAGGAWQWAVRGGGTAADGGLGIVRDAAGQLTVTGTFAGAAAGFGPLPALTAAGGSDVVVAQLDGDGAWRWALRGGGSGDDYGVAIAQAPNGDARVAGGFEGASATFGDAALPGGTKYYDTFAARSFVANVTDLARRSPTQFTLWPNPSAGPVWAAGMAPDQPVQVYDVLGRLVAADVRPAYQADGLALPVLAPGTYVVRSGAQARRLVLQ